MRITLLTPTRNRFASFKLVERWMQRQTASWLEWIVVNDGTEPYEYSCGQRVIKRVPEVDEAPKLSLPKNLLAGLAEVRGDCVIFVEDDDWHGPAFVEGIADALETCGLAGYAPSLYHNVRLKRAKQHANKRHTSLGESGLLREHIPTFVRILERGRLISDIPLWKHARCRKALLPVFDRKTRLAHHVGIKGLGGQPGVVRFHREELGQPDLDLATLKAWVGVKDAEAYRELVSA